MKHILVWLLLLRCAAAFTQHTETDSLEWFIQKQVEDYKIPGLSVGVIKNNEVVFSKGFGVSIKKDTTQVTPETIFPILSCTKAFTATAIGILVDEGKIRWDDKVIKFLPGFKLSDPSVTRQLTIRDILSHRSGLESFEGDLLWYGTDYTRDEIVKRIQYSPLKNKFRQQYGYQNIMYLVAGEIIQKVTGKKWEHFLKERIFSPLQMHSTHTTRYLYNIAPSGAINSNIDDLLTWVKFWMNDGVHNGRRILSRQSFTTITSPHIFISDRKEESYGMGWQIDADKNNKVIGHGGGMPGFKSWITIDITHKIGIIILTNRITYLNEELAGIILEYLNTGKMDWLEKDKGLLTKNIRFGWEENKNFYHSPAPEFQEYTGIYEDRQYGKTIIKKDGDTAVIEFLPAGKQYKGYLTYINRDTLHIDFSDSFIPSGNLVFSRTNNKLSTFKIDIPPGDFIFSNFIFTRRN